eukprot:3447280-Rhodomonas_salina.3
MLCPVLSQRMLPIELRTCYAMSGTDLAYAATRKTEGGEEARVGPKSAALFMLVSYSAVPQYA